MIGYILSMIGSAVLLGTLVQAARKIATVDRWSWLPLAAATLVVMPLGDLSLGRWIHSFTGFLSIPLMVLLLGYTISPLIGSRWQPRNPIQPTLARYRWLVTLIGLCYFPTAMGAGNVDLHAWGWMPGFVWVPLSISIGLWWIAEVRLACLFLLSLIAWQSQVYETTNGWNYLIDPFAIIFSAAGIASTAFSSRRDSERRLSLPMSTGALSMDEQRTVPSGSRAA